MNSMPVDPARPIAFPFASIDPIATPDIPAAPTLRMVLPLAVTGPPVATASTPFPAARTMSLLLATTGADAVATTAMALPPIASRVLPFTVVAPRTTTAPIPLEAVPVT